MTPKEFVRGFYQDKQDLLNLYFNFDKPCHVTLLITQLGLDDAAKDKLKQILDSVLTDAYYTMLLGLDGAANIGGKQLMYQLFDEDGNELTGSGEIEAQAYEYFHHRKQ